MKKKYLGLIMIIIGVLIVGGALAMRFYGIQKQNNMIKNYEQALEEMDKTKDKTKDGDSTDDSDYNPDLAAPTLDIEGTIGIIKIPKIDLKVAIGDGVDMDTLKYAVGHYTDSVYPGDVGNCSIAGHRSYTYSEYFNRLDEVEIGDEILIVTSNGEFTYKVYDKFIVEPEETWVLDDSKDSELTLITCTPVRSATHRLIIKGKLE
ncbi:MAG: class D sortase [Clostridiaceae bacterium]